MPGQLFYGSVCLSDMIDLAKKKHSAFSKGNNGKIYANINVWLNDEKDKYGNIMSVQVNPSKEMKDLEDRVYIGNLKESERAKPVSDRDVSNIDSNFDVPSRQSSSASNGILPADITEPIEGSSFLI